MLIILGIQTTCNYNIHVDWTKSRENGHESIF